MLGHELRNPLGAIQLAVEMLERRDEAAAQHRFRSVIDRQSRHLSKLVDDLLDVARVTLGKIVLHPGPVDVEAVLKSAVEALQPSARGRQLDLTLCTDGPLPVQGDRVRLDQIVENLLTNAIKYTPPGGHIHVDGRRVEHSAAIRVIDTGIGVEPSMLDAIFDLFAQADRSLDRAQGGMGLGLTLVRNLVGLHGGRVVALSDGVGRGTEFRIELPLNEAALVAVPLQPITTDDSRASKRLVVVEDSEDIRSMLTELLEALGHQVSSANNGPQGVALIVETVPDIAFVDVGLPGFNGFEVARRVREATSDVMLVAVTGYGQAEDRKRAFEVGFDRHLTKPIGVTQLRKVLDEVCPARIGEQTLSSASPPPKLAGGEFAAAR